MNEKLYVYSGECRLGVVGQPTPLKDVYGNDLFVGDIVLTYTDNFTPDGLTAIVSDEFTSYSDGTHKTKNGTVEHYAMGIRSAKPGADQWKILRVKSCADVVDGEHWQEFGFSYRSEVL